MNISKLKVHYIDVRFRFSSKGGSKKSESNPIENKINTDSLSVDFYAHNNLLFFTKGVTGMANCKSLPVKIS